MSTAPNDASLGLVERLARALGFDPAIDLSATGGKVGGADYCLGREGRPMLFVAIERASSESAYRLRRYGWSAKVPVSVLLTPEELTVVECCTRPSARDPLEELVILRCSAEELEQNADRVLSLFSRLTPDGSSDSATHARRREDVDAAYLSDVERARQRLAGTDGVLERLLCSRFREDRGIDAYGRLADSVEATEHRDVIQSLYYPDCPYELSALSPEVLGLLHERSLGTDHGQARKTAGVYYTPDRVVRYVVKSALDPLLEAKSPEDAAQVRILDPACGAGSFLLGAFQYLLAWHRHWYMSHRPELHTSGSRPVLFRHPRGTWELTSRKRREIVESCIFGVDLDPRAVELTRLALGLETAAGDGGERLPQLDSNIRCGNSLVSSSFDYPRTFPSIFDDGGFDAVIGNPPYLSYGGRQSVELSKAERDYFAAHYECAGWSTAHSFFMERSVKDLSRRLVSFIVPDQVGHLDGYRSLRGLVVRESGLVEVKYWGERVFKEVVTPSLTFLLDKSRPARSTRVVDQSGTTEVGTIRDGDPWTFSSSRALLDKLRLGSMSIRPYLADCGVRTTDAKRQVVKLAEARGKFVPTLEGKQVGRYWCAPPEVAVRLDSGARVFFGREPKYESARFLIRQTAAYPIAGPREHATYFRNSLHALYAPNGDVDVRYLVGLLNSKLIRFAYVVTIREASQRVFPQVKLGPLGTLPIRALDLGSPTDRAQHDRVVELVDAMLVAQRELRGDADESRAEERRSRVLQIDAEIDRTVFDLYGLTKGEVEQIDAVIATLAPAP
jgi:hypothetical protein